MDEYKNKLEKERRWYSQNTFQVNHFLNSQLFYSWERNSFNYKFPKRQLSNSVSEIINLNNLDNPNILIAPAGVGDDIQYFKHLTDNISGIDISKEAINEIRDTSIRKYVGDIKNMQMFPDGHFDIVIVPLFFHHFCRFGFDVFLKEIYRVLKPGGYLFSLEPSSLNPLSLIARIVKVMFGNITGTVEDEAPFIPLRLSKAMKRCGFCNIRVFGAGFSHNRLPVWLAKINNIMTYPFLKLPVIKYFAWMCLFYGKK